MIQPILKKIVIENFRGQKFREFDFEDIHTTIIGDNKKGKTTVKNAYNWCLIGKDTEGNLDNSVKPKDRDTGKDVNHTDSKVTCVFDLSGKEKTFSRCYKEVWRKNRKTNDKEFSGHDVEYTVDDISKGKSAYNKELEAFFGVDIEKLRILIDISYFGMQLDKKKRRSYISDLIPGVTYSSIAESNPEFEKLELGDKDPFEYKSHCGKRKREINEEIETILPAKIAGSDELVAKINVIPFARHESELNRKSTELEKLMRQKAEFSISEAENEIKNTCKERVEIARSDIKKAEFQIMNIESEIKADIARDSVDLNNSIDEQRSKLTELSKQYREIEQSHDNNALEVEHIDNVNNGLDDDLKSYRKEFAQLNEKVFSYTEEDYANDVTCSHCGRSCSCNSETYQEKYDRKKEGFNNSINLRKSELNDLGKSAKEAIAKNNERRDILVAQNDKLFSGPLSELQNLIKDCSSKIESMKEQLNDIESKPRNEKENKIIELKEFIEGSEAAIETMYQEEKDALKKLSDSNDDEQKKEIEEKITSLKDQIESHQGELAKKETLKEHREHRKEYDEQIKANAKLWEKYNLQEMLADKLIKAYISAIEEPVNNRFSITQVKLFDEYIGVDGLKEVCEMLDQGVEISKTNTAQKINCGIDIRNAFAEEWNCNPPVFIDFAESVSIPENSINNGQMIFLEKVKDQELQIK